MNFRSKLYTLKTAYRSLYNKYNNLFYRNIYLNHSNFSTSVIFFLSQAILFFISTQESVSETKFARARKKIVSNSRDGGIKPNGRSCSSLIYSVFFSRVFRPRYSADLIALHRRWPPSWLFSTLMVY